MISTPAASELISYCQENRRICPTPQRWSELYDLLPDKIQNPNGSWSPSLPLILTAWHVTTGLQKMLRLREHIKYADQAGVISEIDEFLRSLDEDDWYQIGDD